MVVMKDKKNSNFYKMNMSKFTNFPSDKDVEDDYQLYKIKFNRQRTVWAFVKSTGIWDVVCTIQKNLNIR